MRENAHTMSDSETDGFFSYTDDGDFAKKFAIACACAVGIIFVVPGLLFLGYLVQTMKRSTLGRKGLPEWTNFGELFSLGAVGLISLVYLLPAALLFALSVLPTLGATASFFSVSALVSRFINFGAILAFAVGLAFTVSALHTYLSSGKLTDIFDFRSLAGKIRSKKADLGFLIGLAAVGLVAISALNWLLPGFLSFFGVLLGVVGTPFIALMVAYGSGYILGKTTPQLPQTADPEAQDSMATQPSQPEETSSPQPADSEDRWIPT